MLDFIGLTKHPSGAPMVANRSQRNCMSASETQTETLSTYPRRCIMPLKPSSSGLPLRRQVVALSHNSMSSGWRRLAPTRDAKMGDSGQPWLTGGINCSWKNCSQISPGGVVAASTWCQRSGIMALAAAAAQQWQRWRQHGGGGGRATGDSDAAAWRQCSGDSSTAALWQRQQRSAEAVAAAWWQWWQLGGSGGSGDRGSLAAVRRRQWQQQLLGGGVVVAAAAAAAGQQWRQ
jgi:hypothetical protein